MLSETAPRTNPAHPLADAGVVALHLRKQIKHDQSK